MEFKFPEGKKDLVTYGLFILPHKLRMSQCNHQEADTSPVIHLIDAMKKELVWYAV